MPQYSTAVPTVASTAVPTVVPTVVPTASMSTPMVVLPEAVPQTQVPEDDAKVEGHDRRRSDRPRPVRGKEGGGDGAHVKGVQLRQPSAQSLMYVGTWEYRFRRVAMEQGGMALAACLP